MGFLLSFKLFLSKSLKRKRYNLLLLADSMSLKDIQEEVDTWTRQFSPQYWPPHEILARLIEEVGELAREVNHLHGTKKKKQTEAEKNLGQELSDILFTAVCMANRHKIDLKKEWDEMMRKKHYGRDQNRFEKK